MKSFYKSRFVHIFGLLICALTWLANNSNPPTGRTGASFDTGSCADCHGGGSFTGGITVDGLPSTIEPNIVYPLSITMTPTSGSPVRGGFQLVVVDGSNANSGNLANANGQSGTEFFMTREYLEQRGAKAFGGNPITWSFNWTAPPTASGNTIKIYYVGNFCNGDGNTGGDYVLTGSETYTLNGPPQVTATITNITNVLCNGGNTGSLTVEGGGGIPPYTYHWSNNQTTATADNLIAGTYSVTVTGSSGSGSAITSGTVTQPTAITGTATSSNQITCAMTSTTVTANVSGGIPGYTYQWSNGNSGNPTTYTTGGPQTVTVMDNNGCTKVIPFTISTNTVTPNAAASASGTLSCTLTTVPLSGAGSSQGASYSYLWTTANGVIVSGATSINAVAGAAGTYTLQVTNNTNGCTNTASTTVTSTANPPSASAVGGTLTCTNTTVMLQGNSGTSGVTYAWSGPGINGTNMNLQNPVVNLAGNYTVTVTNPANGCTNTAAAVVASNVAVPDISTTPPAVLNCAVNSVTLSVNSTTGGVTYSWTGPDNFSSTLQNPSVSVAGNYTAVVTAPNGCTAQSTVTVNANTTPPTATLSVSGPLTCAVSTVQLSAGTNAPNATYQWAGPNNFTGASQTVNATAVGTYTVTVTNTVNGCTATATANVTQNITPPVAVIATPAHLNCNNVTLLLDGSGSSQGVNITYAWTASNGGNIVSGANTLTPLIDQAGTYIFNVTNTDNGCSASANIVVIQTPPLSAVGVVSSNVSCNGGANGAATLNINGGTGTNTIAWSTGVTTISAGNLAAGTYSATVTDSENCSATASVTITQPTVLQLTASATGETSVGANNGTATAAASGGTMPYTYVWSNGPTTATITGLAPGSYSVTATDNNGCTSVQTVTVNSFGCVLAATATTTNVTCNGASNGSASVSLSGATDPVTYAWSNGANTAVVSGLAPDSYTVSVLDGSGCPATLSINITEPPALIANATSTNVTATNVNDGTATAVPTGGTAPYTYIWSNGPTTATISGLAPGAYTVSVTDDNGCSTSQTVTVNAFNCNLAATVSSTPATCNGGANGTATAIPTGGTAPYTYIWSNGGTGSAITGLVAGTYFVTLNDGSGCVTTQMGNVGQPTPITASAFVLNASCPETADGSVLITVTGGTPAYTYTLPGLNGMNLLPGNYISTITDAQGCFTTLNFSIGSNDQTPPTINCPGNIVFCGFDIVDYTAPTISDNCSLANAQVALIGGIPSGGIFLEGISTQVFQVTDASGNTATCSFSVTVFDTPDVGVINSVNDVNNGGSGSIDVEPLAGTGPFTYNWNKDGVSFSTDEDPINLFAGSYTLTMTDANGCTVALAPVVIDNTIATFNPNDASDFRVYPNPAQQVLYVDATDPIQIVAAEIVDAQGRKVLDIQAANLNAPIDIAILPAGLYGLRIQTADTGWVIKKWIKRGE